MATIESATRVGVDVQDAWRLWTDLSRWPAFVEGFKHVERRSGDWPQPGARVEWVSTPGGRGKVTEKVVESQPPQLIVTQVFENAMTATQTVSLTPGEAPRDTRIAYKLDYRLSQAGFLRQITDVLFIRRALAAAVDRTLRRFATEAEEEAAL